MYLRVRGFSLFSNVSIFVSNSSSGVISPVRKSYRIVSPLKSFVKKLKASESKIFFPRLGSIQEIKIALYNDASYANLPDGVSSAGGRILFLVGPR